MGKNLFNIKKKMYCVNTFVLFLLQIMFHIIILCVQIYKVIICLWVLHFQAIIEFWMRTIILKC